MSVPKKVKVKVTHLCLTLCNPMDYTVHGILQARILEWVAFPFSRGSSQPRDQTQISLIAGRFFYLGHKGSPRILEWIAYPFSSGSSQPRNWSRVSCTAGRFFTNGAIGSPRKQKLYADSAKKSISSYCHSHGAGVVVLIQGAGCCCLKSSILWQAEIQFWALGSPSPYMLASP